MVTLSGTGFALQACGVCGDAEALWFPVGEMFLGGRMVVLHYFPSNLLAYLSIMNDFKKR